MENQAVEGVGSFGRVNGQRLCMGRWVLFLAMLMGLLASAQIHAQVASHGVIAQKRITRATDSVRALAEAPVVDLSGTWKGRLQEPGASTPDWVEEFTLTQDPDGKVTGTRRTTSLPDGADWFVWSVTGSVSGSTLTLSDVAVIEQGSTNTPCKITANLSVIASQDGVEFSGAWNPVVAICDGGTLSAGRYDRNATKNLGSGATCDGGLGTTKSGPGSSGTASGNADGSSCAEKMGAAVVGDPIDAATGNFHLQEEDFVGGPWLSFRRFYNSSGAMTPATLGERWRHSFDRSLVISGTPTASVVSLRPDGKQTIFTHSGDTWVGDTPADRLTEVHDDQGVITGYNLFVGGTRQTETYGLDGRLLKVVGQDGQGITLTYTTTASPAIGLLSKVTDSHGRQLQLSYNNKLRLRAIILPDGQIISYGYGNSPANLTLVTYQNQSTRKYSYNEAGFVGKNALLFALTGITDERNIRFESITYDDQGRATSSSFNGGVGATHIAYLDDGSANVTYPLGNTVHLGTVSVDGLMRVASLESPCTPDCGQPWKSRTYDSNGLPVSMTDFNGITTQTVYDATGLLLSTTEAVGLPEERRTETTWDDVLRLPLVTRVLGRDGVPIKVTSNVYNPSGLLLARCDIDMSVSSAAGYACSAAGVAPEGVRRWTYTYCTAIDTTDCPLVGLLLTSTGPRKDVAQTTSYHYYLDDTAQWKHGDLKSVTDPLGHVSSVTIYDSAGRPKRTVDANGVTTDVTYLLRGWFQSKTVRGSADGSGDALTSLEYDTLGNVTKASDPSRIARTFVYDGASRLTDIQDVRGNRIHYVLDAAGNRVKEQILTSAGVALKTISRTYDSMGRLTSVLDGMGRVTLDTSVAGSYDGNGNLVQSIDGLGVQTRAGYDGLNRLVTSIQDAEGVSEATHGAQTVAQYNVLDQIEGFSDPEGLATTYQRNAFGDVLTRVSPDTGTSTATVDASGNITSAKDANGVVVAYAYDALDRRISATYPKAEDNVSWHYDEPDSVTGCVGSSSIGRLTRVIEQAVTTTYCYDKRGNVTKKAQSSGGHTDTVTYSYFLGDQLASVTYPDGRRVAYTLDFSGRIDSMVLSGAGLGETLVGSATYLPFGPIATYTLGSGQKITRTYDANYAATDVVSPVLNLHFSRDVMGNIAAIGEGAGATPVTERYAYDPLYRLTSVNDPSGTAIEAYTYNRTGDRLSKSAPGQATGPYSYKAGTHWLTSVGTTSRTYDANGNTVEIAAGGGDLKFDYNDRNRLSTVEVNGAAYDYLYNAMGQRISKTAVVTGGSTRFAYDESSKLIVENQQAVRDYVWLDDVPVAIVEGSGSTAVLRYIHADALGSPRYVTDRLGATVWSWPYRSNPMGENEPTSSTGFVFNLRFPGQYFDAESGLSYNVNRDYEPATGRYTQSDPIGLRGGQDSTYLYVLANPLSYVDDDGLRVMLCSRPVDIGFVPDFAKPYLRHNWIKTDKYEAGMGAACAVPGQGLCRRPVHANPY